MYPERVNLVQSVLFPYGNVVVLHAHAGKPTAAQGPLIRRAAVCETRQSSEGSRPGHIDSYTCIGCLSTWPVKAKFWRFHQITQDYIIPCICIYFSYHNCDINT